mmetsp:Transcript_27080/g.73485  ORF Transcript_27080/g.73485 Transcript_27080/m.73485 type:complete len:242 (-) Transcript_27080:86-811(-)
MERVELLDGELVQDGPGRARHLLVVAAALGHAGALQGCKRGLERRLRLPDLLPLVRDSFELIARAGAVLDAARAATAKGTCAELQQQHDGEDARCGRLAVAAGAAHGGGKGGSRLAVAAGAVGREGVGVAGRRADAGLGVAEVAGSHLIVGASGVARGRECRRGWAVARRRHMDGSRFSRGAAQIYRLERRLCSDGRPARRRLSVEVNALRHGCGEGARLRNNVGGLRNKGHAGSACTVAS